MGLFQSSFERYERIDYKQWSLPMNEFINSMGFHSTRDKNSTDMILYGRMRCSSMIYLNSLPVTFQKLIIEKLLFLGPNNLPGYNADVGQEAYLTLLILYHTETLQMLFSAYDEMNTLNWGGLRFLDEDYILVPYIDDKRLSYLLTIDRTRRLDEENRQFDPRSEVGSPTSIYSRQQSYVTDNVSVHSVSETGQFQLSARDFKNEPVPSGYQAYAQT